LPWASKFCSWASKNGSLVGKWASGQVFKIYLSQYSNVSDNFQSKQFQNLRLQDEQNNELKAWINLKSKHILLAFILCYSLSLIIDNTTNNNITIIILKIFIAQFSMK